jgi:hypothetical protein
MVKDRKRFADSGEWGWAVFFYDATSDTFRPGTLADKPPQGNDAKCGVACHGMAKTRDYVSRITGTGELNFGTLVLFRHNSTLGSPARCVMRFRNSPSARRPSEGEPDPKRASSVNSVCGGPL